MTDIGKLATEQRNAASEHIDRLPTLDMVRLINNEDKKVAGAVETVCPQIAEAIDGIYARMQRGGRLIYTGCGTSALHGNIPYAITVDQIQIGRRRVFQPATAGFLSKRDH